MIRRNKREEKIYDITDEEKSLETLLRLTDCKNKMKKEIFKNFLHEAKFISGNTDDSFYKMIEQFDIKPNFKREELICHIQHMTTSADECKSIKSKGIKDLRKTYEDVNSELRKFLDECGVKIDIQNKRIYFNETDIGSIEYKSYNNSYDYNSLSHQLWMIGYKFYNDFAVNGFFSFDHKNPYGGFIDKRPEIIFNISNVIRNRIDNIWIETHKCFVVKFCIPYTSIHENNYFNDEIDLLKAAFKNAIGVEEKIATLKNGISVPPENIISIENFSF